MREGSYVSNSTGIAVIIIFVVNTKINITYTSKSSYVDGTTTLVSRQPCSSIVLRYSNMKNHWMMLESSLTLPSLLCNQVICKICR